MRAISTGLWRASYRCPPIAEAPSTLARKLRKRIRNTVLLHGRMPDRLNTLACHHSRLAGIADTAARLVAGSASEACIADLRLLRLDMMDALASYQSFIHQEVFEPAMRGCPGLALDSASALKISCIDLQGSYEAFRMRWSHRDTRENWPEYRLSAMQMVKKVRSHVHSAAALEQSWAGFQHNAKASHFKHQQRSF